MMFGMHNYSLRVICNNNNNNNNNTINNNNNNNNYNKLCLYTTFWEMFSIKNVYITVPHESHNIILYVLTSMVHVALGQITAQYQIQISNENTYIHSNTDRVTNITVE